MILKSLGLTNYRLFEKQTFDFQNGLNVFYGSNGVGKTTVLEAIGFLSTLRSFKKANIREIPRFGTSSAGIDAKLITANRERTIEIHLSDKNKRVSIDSVPSSSGRDLMGLLPCVIFSPEDLSIIKEGPTERRRFLDICLCQMRSKYLLSLSRFRQLLTQKNDILRTGDFKPSLLDLLPEINMQLSQIGEYLSGERETLISRLDESAREYHNLISGGSEKLKLRFRRHAANAQECYEMMLAKQAMELKQKHASFGAQRDDFSITVQNISLRDYGSQGQIRTGALALKLAQQDAFRDILGEEPLLLLDDVLSELDEYRSDMILRNIRSSQVFVTCCEERQWKGAHAICISTSGTAVSCENVTSSVSSISTVAQSPKLPENS